MIVSPFTPLFFLRHRTDGIRSGYVQTFSTSDSILLEIICSRSEGAVQPAVQLVDECTGNVFAGLVLSPWLVNSSTTLWFCSISPSVGLWSVYIDGIGKSEPFRVTDDARELAKTTLIQYSMRNNRQRNDALFVIDGIHYFFDFRVHGGFKDSGWSFGVESEQFVTMNADIAQLYGMESTQKRFTLGGGMGVPVWFGEMLNRILVCSHVYFDGVKYCRKESNVPELNVQLEGVNSFVFSQALQQTANLDPLVEMENHAIMRRLSVQDYRKFTDENNRLIR